MGKRNYEKKLPQFIYLLGPEGAGKTTQIRILAKWLSRQGHGSKWVQIRTNHLFVYYLRKLFVKLDYFDRRLLKAAEMGTWNTYVPKIIESMYPFLFLLQAINALILALFQVFIPIFFGTVVLAEHYIIDTVCDLQREFSKIKSRKRTNLYKFVMKTLLRFFPDSSVIIILDADYQELVRRYEERSSLVEPADYIYVRRKQIFKITDRFHETYYVNTEDKTKIEVFKEIKKILLEKGRGGSHKPYF